MKDSPTKERSDQDTATVITDDGGASSKLEKLREKVREARELIDAEKQPSNELQDFDIGKVYAAYFESTKLSSTSFITYIFLLAVTALLVFSRGIEGNITIPLLRLILIFGAT
ncbi:MAG: hypothetical protein M3371_01890 [Acidobacteriota bacterium]|nr:hypothetical protein [Acidobacteriota bacterium]